MIKKTIIQIIVIICLSANLYSQNYNAEKHPKFHIGLSSNYLSVSSSQYNPVLSNPILDIDNKFTLGYGFNSAIEIPINKIVAFESGINFSVYFFKYKISVLDDDEFILKNETFRDFHPTLEIPLILNFNLLNNKSNLLQLSTGFSYYSNIYFDNDMGVGIDSSYRVRAIMSPDLDIGVNGFSGVNFSLNLKANYSKKLKNNNSIRFSLSYNRFFRTNPVAHFKLLFD
jgi:hypothetical protein